MMPLRLLKCAGEIGCRCNSTAPPHSVRRQANACDACRRSLNCATVPVVWTASGEE
jgi:hypothetical protein